MKALTIPDAAIAIPALQEEIRRSQESRYDHRLHGLLLVAQGMSCREVAGLLGDAHSTVAYWVRRYEEEGLAGLVDGDRPGRLSASPRNNWHNLPRRCENLLRTSAFLRIFGTAKPWLLLSPSNGKSIWACDSANDCFDSLASAGASRVL